MAKKSRKSARKMAHTTDKVTPGKSVRVISEGEFQRLDRAVNQAQSDMDEARGRIGSAVSNAVEKKFLHKGAYGVIRRIKKQSDAKLSDWMQNFEHMCEVSGINDRINKQQEMFARKEVLAAVTIPDEDEAPKRKGRPAKPPRAGSFAEKLQRAREQDQEQDTKVPPPGDDFPEEGPSDARH